MPDEEFRDFVEQRYAQLLRTAHLLCGSSDRAEDLLQSALVSLMRRWRHVEHPEAYVRRSIVNHLVNWWRRPIREVVTAFLPDRGYLDDSHVERDELWRALGLLPIRMRAVLVLRYWEDRSEQETADILGIRVGTVKSQASRGLARLREILTSQPDHPLTMAKGASR